MAQTKRRLMIFVVLALLAIFAACKGESPTAPPVTTPNTPSGGGTSPAGTTTLALAASNPSPVINSTSVITATVTVNGAPAPNGTAVEFITNLGTFTEVSDVKVIRTTTNGVTTATLTSADAGAATVTATVNNLSRSIVVTFGATPTGPPPPVSTAPTITAVNPNFGLPTGGETITITGTNFIAPVRVIFDFGPGKPTKDGLVVSVTPTQIVVVTPPIDLSSGQTQAAAITVITQAGTASEQRVSRASAFTFQLAVLTPVIRAMSPTAGPIEGGTRVTIIGDAFQAPLQVFFGSAQAQVINVQFNQIVAISPTARDTAPNGSGAVTGPVDVRVLNVGSGKSVTLAAGFRYTPKMQITAITPGQGLATGGTRVTIDGVGFDDPATVTFGGAAAQVIKVTGTQIIAVTSALQDICGSTAGTGPTVVTNVNNGDQATGPIFTYIAVKSTIVSVTPASTLGGSATVAVLNAVGVPRISIGGVAATITGSTTDPVTNVTTFTVIVPPTLKLTTLACTGVPGALQQQPTAFDVAFSSLTTSCTSTLANGITINPTNAPVLLVTPTALTPFSARITPGLVVNLTSGGAGFTSAPIVTFTGGGGAGAAATSTITSPPPGSVSTVTVTNPGIGYTSAPTVGFSGGGGAGATATAVVTTTVTQSTPQTLTLANTGPAPLTITSITQTGATCSAFSVFGPPTPTTLNQCESAPITVTYKGSQSTPPVPSTDTCQLQVLTSAGNKTFNLLGSSQ
ncbi:MAG: IPT/TIG domain-containing protein [Thermoanaerobaculia bacterium]